MQTEKAALLLELARIVLLASLCALSVSGCSPTTTPTARRISPAGGVPQETVDPAVDPLRWKMLQNPAIPRGAPIAGGPSVLQVVNPIRDTVLVIFARPGRAGWFFVDKGRTSQHSVEDGSYQMFFVYAEEPDALYQGDDVSVASQIATITLRPVSDGNYGIRRVR
jgi:hypothetical protein